MTLHDEIKLIDRFRYDGDSQAFGDLLSAYDAKMYATAYSILRQEADARDAMQDAALRAFQNIDALADPSRFAGWLMRIVFGCSIDRLRARRSNLSLDHETAPDPPTSAPPPEAHLDAREWVNQLTQALEALPPRYRKPLLLFHLDGLSTRQVAQHLDLPPSTARSLLSRARARLGDRLPTTFPDLPDMANELFREHTTSTGLVTEIELGCLHVMNGDAAAEPLRKSGIPDPVVVWSDILHEGPTPLDVSPDAWRQTRAEHLASMGFVDVATIKQQLAEADDALADPGDGRERVFWFEHDLYDQLLLLRHLHWLDQHDPEARGRVSLICIGHFPGIERFIGLGQLEPDQIASLLDTRQPLTVEHLQLGRRVWEDFCDPDPRKLQAWLDRDTSLLPYLNAALRRHFRQYPSAFNGLGQTEQWLLETASASSTTTAGELFAQSQAREAAPFLGDAVVYHYLQRLAASPTPAIRLLAGQDVVDARTHIALTDFGQQLLRGAADQIRTNGIDRWFGGVHLINGTPLWRWDGTRHNLVEAKSPLG